VVDIVRANGGAFVRASGDDDDWCGTGKLPWPRPKFGLALEELAISGYSLEVFPLGKPAIDEILVNIQRLNLNRLAVGK
jgi:hypothetical protein